MATWFYLERGERRGPVDIDLLVSALVLAPDPRTIKVWREGMPGWEDAGSVAELSAKLPPPGRRFQREVKDYRR
jgi:hypothetical protein